MPRLLTFIICLLLANLLLVVDLHAAVSPAVNNKKSGRPAATVTIDEIMRLAGDGVAVELGPDKSFAIFAEERIGSPQGGVILLHDHGAHPNSAGVISPLRDRLPEFGWATLSVQLPVSTAATTEQRDSLQQVALSRIGAGVEHLSNRGIRNIVLIGHGSGAVLAAEFLAADNTPSEAQGFIGISMAAATTPENRLLQFIENIRVPILDLYGSVDRRSVIDSAQQRVRAARRGANSASQNREAESFKFSDVAQSGLNKSHGRIAYRQFEIAGADHLFTGSQEQLIKRVRGWLKRHASGGKQSLKPARSGQ